MRHVSGTRILTAHAACDTILSHCVVSVQRPGACWRKRRRRGGTLTLERSMPRTTKSCIGSADVVSVLELLPVAPRHSPFHRETRLFSRLRTDFAISAEKTFR